MEHEWQGQDNNVAILTRQLPIFENDPKSCVCSHGLADIDSKSKAQMTGVLANRKWMTEACNSRVIHFKRQIKKPWLLDGEQMAFLSRTWWGECRELTWMSENKDCLACLALNTVLSCSQETNNHVTITEQAHLRFWSSDTLIEVIKRERKKKRHYNKQKPASLFCSLFLLSHHSWIPKLHADITYVTPQMCGSMKGHLYDSACWWNTAAGVRDSTPSGYTVKMFRLNRIKN